MSDRLTMSAAAKVLGISKRTLERHLAEYVADGLTVHRTPGGHRRLERAEVEALRPPPEPTPMPHTD